ncbi:MAG TPA: FAD-binding oxidoreductase [Thermoanaerobaculia bacterium]|nr:FAD-binding oxidoreductase [Thermoanaerobaculia bacterium]
MRGGSLKRWNGWGDESVSLAVPPAAARLLEARIGPGAPPKDAALADVVAGAPPPRLAPGRLVTTDAETRVRHARGQSLPDWIALKSGRLGALPDAVAYPESDADVRELLAMARAGVRLVPYGGGTSVVGGVNPAPGDAPVLTIDLARVNGLLDLDETSRLATFGAGILGPDLEAALRARGYTVGHFPQSFEHSTLGGWVATRSSGQESRGYGRIEDLFAGGRLEAPSGTLVMPPFPASAAGPDVRQMILGSEGRLGIVTEATVRVTPIAAREEVRAFFFSGDERALAATRALAQTRLPLSMLRLSLAEETESALLLAGAGPTARALDAWLALRGVKAGRCLLLAGASGEEAPVARALAAAEDLVLSARGVPGPAALGRRFLRDRFRGPYLRNALWDLGYAVDTLETATTWEKVPALVAAVEHALSSSLEALGERLHVFTHLSHAYPSGSSAYTTYVFRAAEPDATLRRWELAKRAASEAIVRAGATISHQHGVGSDHLPYLAAEKGELGVASLAALARVFDPAGAMNPGKLVP